MAYSIEQAKRDIDNIDLNATLLNKMVLVTSILTKYMEKFNQKHALPIVVGGLSMEIYTGSEYVTHDIDVVTTASKELDNLLMQIGFNKDNRIYIHHDLNIAVDIVDNALEKNEYQRLTKIQIDEYNYLFSISPEDILYDRALSYDYADTKRYGIYLLTNNFNELDIKYIRDRLRTDDLDALAAFDEWVEIARKYN